MYCAENRFFICLFTSELYFSILLEKCQGSGDNVGILLLRTAEPKEEEEEGEVGKKRQPMAVDVRHGL